MAVVLSIDLVVTAVESAGKAIGTIRTNDVGLDGAGNACSSGRPPHWERGYPDGQAPCRIAAGRQPVLLVGRGVGTRTQANQRAYGNKNDGH